MLKGNFFVLQSGSRSSNESFFKTLFYVYFFMAKKNDVIENTQKMGFQTVKSRKELKDFFI